VKLDRVVFKFAVVQIAGV